MIDIIDKCKLSETKQYYMNGEILYLDGSDYALLRISGSTQFPTVAALYGIDHFIGTYAIINARGNAVCTRKIYDYDLKVLGYEAENALSGDIAVILHYNGGARLTEYMDRVHCQRGHATYVKELINNVENNFKTNISEEE